MRIAAIADIHGNLDALRAVLAHIGKKSSPDLIVNLGDHVSGPLQPRETADILINTRHVAIRGNHDRQLLEAAAGMVPRIDTHRSSFPANTAHGSKRYPQPPR